MAAKLPKYTWESSTLTLKGIKRTVFSTVTGEVVGEIKDGKFVQSVKEIPQPTVKPKKTVTVPETAIKGGQQVTLANLERDANYWKSVAEDIRESAANRAKARNEYNKLQPEIAKFQSKVEAIGGAEKAKAEAAAKDKARADFDKLKSEYQTLEKKFNALLSPGTDPKGREYQRKMYEIVNKSLGLYKTFSGNAISVASVTSLLSTGKIPTNKTKTQTTGNAPTGGNIPAGKVTLTGDTEKPANVNDFIKNARPLPIVENMPDGKDKPTGPITTPGKTDAEIMAQAQSLYGNIDEIFNTNEELKALIRKAVENKYEPDRFLNELEGTTWFKTNAGPIRQRGFYKRQYDALVNAIKKDDPNYQAKITELDRTSEYGRGLQDAIESVTADWTSQYGTPTAEDLITIRTIASDLYQYANETDPTKIRNAVLSKPKTIAAGGVAGGAMGQNLQTLRSVAEANGLNLDKDFKTSVPTWMDRIAKGESIETIKSLIRNAAKTTWNVNDRVANLLDQGVDLATIYSPYRTRMSTLLEIAPDTISFSDLASKGVIGGKEEKNLYDFEKELRRDSRWQYTKNARDEVSSSVFQVLRDFGFQG